MWLLLVPVARAEPGYPTVVEMLGLLGWLLICFLVAVGVVAGVGALIGLVVKRWFPESSWKKRTLVGAGIAVGVALLLFEMYSTVGALTGIRLIGCG